jgi:hypothetical protein
VVLGFTVASAALAFPAAVDLIDRGPGAAFGFLGGLPALFVTFRDMFGLAFLLVCVLTLISPWHGIFLFDNFSKRQHTTISIPCCARNEPIVNFTGTAFANDMLPLMDQPI